MVKEIFDHTSRGHWRILTKAEMRKSNYFYQPIMAIWSFKRKRTPFGEIMKYKARLCCHSGQTIKGVHYNETYSPVVAWSTLQLILTLSLVHNWDARQIDFVLVFPQANLWTNIYMHIPQKFEVKQEKLVLNENAPPPQRQEEVLKLIKNVYSLANAGYTWHQHVKKGLFELGFRASKIDPCLFYKGQVLLVLYVDDAICLSPNPKDASKLINDLKTRGYVLTDEGPLSAYLGLQVERLSDKRIRLTQPTFIERIIEQAKLKDARMHDTPADQVLNRDAEGQEKKNKFHYRSIVGQLNYLAATTRPEIQFAVHQCARFCENPKMSHKKAVKRIVRYLKKTKDKGLILSIDDSKGVECWVDADFAGGYNKNIKNLTPRDMLSRTGYVIKYAGCPIVWTLKLQSTIALSTTEAEYIALSMAMREVIFMLHLMDELHTEGIKLIKDKPKVYCRVFEDNAGAIELAKMPKLRPRTKHIAIQYHHFREWTVKGVNNEKPRIQVKYIQTSEQEADIMMKPLPHVTFEHIRKLLCGW